MIGAPRYLDSYEINTNIMECNKEKLLYIY